MMVSEPVPRRLLVVDDEPLVRQTLSLVLQDEYEVTAVGSGEEAIEASLRESFPVVILDLCMDGLSGIETLQRLKKIRDTQNIIILTAHESTETAIAALNLGAFNYLTKPFERVHLKEVVSRGFDLYEERSARRRDMQERLMGVHDNFFALLCHEFNTPLNIILGFSELLSSTTDDPEHASWIQHIKEAGSHLHDILMEIVDYTAASHLAAAGVEKLFVPETLLRPILDSFRIEGITVDLDSTLPEEGRMVGASDAGFMILRKMMRMASQRSKHLRLKAKIEAQDGPDLSFTVSGTGIRRDAMGRMEIEDLFEPYQLNSANGTARGMTLGLELATCRKIAEYAHASVEGMFNADGELEFTTRIPVQLIR